MLTAVCVHSCLTAKGCGDPELGWGSVCHLAVWVLFGTGWDGVFKASGVLVRHQRFCWGIC